MMRRSILAMAGAWLLAAGSPVLAQQPPSAELNALFGPAVEAHPLAAAPVATLDLDGDGKPDDVWVVRLLRGGNDALAAGTRSANPLGKRGLARQGEKLALAIRHGTGERWVLHDSEFFTTPIWQTKPLPLEAARRGGKAHRAAVAAGAKPRGDLLLLGTEAGIDIALFWTGNRYVVNAPKEEP